MLLALAGGAQAGERLERAAVASDLVVADHGSLSVDGGPDIMR